MFACESSRKMHVVFHLTKEAASKRLIESKEGDINGKSPFLIMLFCHIAA